MKIDARHVSVDIDDYKILHDISIHALSGEMIGLIGPNGSGKSTFLRSIYRMLKPISGTIFIGEKQLWKDLSSRETAKRVAAVTQERSADFDFSVLDVLASGRTPHKGLLEKDNAEDRAIIAEAINRVGMSDKVGRLFGTLSGGEKQKVLIARALIQQSQILLLDEPTNHLDIHAQLLLLKLVKSLNLTIIAALHDINLAGEFCDRLYVFQNGRIVAHGEVDEVLVPPVLENVYKIKAYCGTHPLTGKRYVFFNSLPDGGKDY